MGRQKSGGVEKPSQNPAIHIGCRPSTAKQTDSHFGPCKTCTLFGNQGLSGLLFFFPLHLVLFPSSSSSTHFPFFLLLSHVESFRSRWQSPRVGGTTGSGTERCRSGSRVVSKADSAPDSGCHSSSDADRHTSTGHSSPSSDPKHLPVLGAHLPSASCCAPLFLPWSPREMLGST